jgi:ribosome-binding factor A
MSSRRVLKAAQAIREVVSMAIIADLKDPRIADVTVTFVEVSPDLRLAKVNVSVMGDESKQKLCLHGLQNSAGYLQQKVGRRIDTKYTPRIQFVIDKGMQNSMIVTKILEEVLPRSVDENDESAESSSDESDETTDDAVDQESADQGNGDLSGDATTQVEANSPESDLS